jgi:hypothetical protein
MLAPSEASNLFSLPECVLLSRCPGPWDANGRYRVHPVGRGRKPSRNNTGRSYTNYRGSYEKRAGVPCECLYLDPSLLASVASPKLDLRLDSALSLLRSLAVCCNLHTLWDMETGASCYRPPKMRVLRVLLENSPNPRVMRVLCVPVHGYFASRVLQTRVITSPFLASLPSSSGCNRALKCWRRPCSLLVVVGVRA